MRKSPINIIGGFYKDPNLHWSRQDTLNWIPVAAEQGGTLTQYQLRDAPGVKPFVRITRDVEVPGDPPTIAVIDVGPVRGMRNVEGKLFVVAAQTVYQISNTGVAIPVGTIPGVGRVSMAHNQFGLSNQLIIVNGSAGYIVDTSLLTITKITDEGYPGAFVADYIDQYLAQVEPQGRYWFHSDLAQGLHYNTLDRYEAEADPDRIVSLLVSHREVLIFGKDTIEPFVNTGGQTGTFERASNTVIEVGCSAKFTPRKLDNSVFWLDDKRLVRRLDGYTPIRISTDAIDAAFSECSEAEIAQAYAFTWETRGHKVYYITVPGRFTFGYDVLTRQWHRRSTWNLPHWDVIDAAFWNGKWIVASGRYGRLYELDQDYKLDSCDPLVRKRVTGKLWDSENDLTLNNVELKFNTGGKASVCVLFPEQPEGPSITGSAPDGFTGDPYSFSYTTAPGDSPIARTVIRNETTVLVDGEPSTLAAAGFTWNQSTATISSANVASNVVVSLSLRVYDTAGLYADHTDEFIVVQEVALLVTGSEKTLSGPLFARASALSDLTFEGILTSTGADISDSTATFADDLFVAVSSAGARYAADSAGSWTTGTVGSFPGGSPNFGKIVGSPAGYLAVIPEDSSNPTAFIAPSPPTAFTRTTLLATNTEGNPTTDVQKANNVLFVNDWYVLCYSRSFFQSSVPEGPYVAVWDEFKEIDSGRNPNAESIVAWYDFAFFNDAWYAIISWDFELSTRKTQLIRSENGITDWSVFTVLVDIGYADAEAPIQLCAGGDRLVCYNSGGTLRTDADDFATVIETGLSGPGINHLRDGRKIVYTGALFYCIGSSDTCVTFNPITLEVGELTTMPINGAVSISCNFVEFS